MRVLAAQEKEWMSVARGVHEESNQRLAEMVMVVGESGSRECRGKESGRGARAERAVGGCRGGLRATVARRAGSRDGVWLAKKGRRGICWRGYRWGAVSACLALLSRLNPPRRASEVVVSAGGQEREACVQPGERETAWRAREPRPRPSKTAASAFVSPVRLQYASAISLLNMLTNMDEFSTLFRYVD